MVYSCNGPGFILSITSLYVSESCSQAPHSHLFFRLAKSSSLSLSSEGEVLQLSHSHFECLSWIVEPQMSSSKWGLTSGEEREIITSFNLLALILPVQPVMLPASLLPGHAAAASSACCLHRAPGPPQHSCSPASWSPAYFSGFFFSWCRTSHLCLLNFTSFLKPIHSACLSPSDW